MRGSFAPASTTVIGKIKASSLTSGFIFEILDSGREAAVLDHIWIPKHLELEREGHGLAEGALLEDAAANKLSAYLSKDSVTACLENVDLPDLGFLMQLLRFELRFFRRPFCMRLLLRMFEKHLLEQVGSKPFGLRSKNATAASVLCSACNCFAS